MTYATLMAQEPSRCEPTSRCMQHCNCARAHAEIPADTWWTPVIDASLVRWPEGMCPMFIRRPVEIA